MRAKFKANDGGVNRVRSEYRRGGTGKKVCSCQSRIKKVPCKVGGETEQRREAYLRSSI